MRNPARGEPSITAVLAYGLPALPVAAIMLPLYVVLPAHYASLGVSIALAGQILLGVRLFDALIDPVAGYLADRSGKRFGRRRTWFAAGVPLMALSAWMLFTPSSDSAAWSLLIWGLALSIGWAVSVIPYQAWGAELSPSYAGRNRVAAWREGFAFLGTLLALSSQALFSGTGPALAFLALFAVAALPLTALLAVTNVPEPKDYSVAAPDFRAGLAQLFANRLFLRLVAAFFLNGFANGLPATLFLFFVSDRLGLADKAGPFLLAYFIAGAAAMPFWLMLSKRIGKHRAWFWAMILASLGFAAAPFLHEGAALAFLAVCIVTGLCVGADLVLPVSLQADVIDADTAASGAQRSALYIAFWALAGKFALALAAGIALPALAASGYDPGTGAKTASGLAMLAFFYAGLPVLLKLCAAALIWNFPLDEARQQILRRDIEARAAR